jgi:hypothetical protein
VALNELIHSETRDPNDVKIIFNELRNNIYETGDSIEKLDKQLSIWIAYLESEGSDINPARLYVWRRSFIETFIPGIVRAERELGNALKAAEYRYVRQLRFFSHSVATIETIWVNFYAVSSFFFQETIIESSYKTLGAVLTYGILILGPEFGKGILQAVTGLGSRLKK